MKRAESNDWIGKNSDKKKGRETEVSQNEELRVFNESEFCHLTDEESKYCMNRILKKVFGQDTQQHNLYLSKNYEDICAFNIRMIRALCSAVSGKISNETIWNMICSFYIDPDPVAVKMRNGIICTADGLLSKLRIYSMDGLDDLADTYETYRKKPIFFFPKEANGINTTRCGVFGDRIDYTLLDIKNRLTARTALDIENCRLAKAYAQPKTKAWLDSFNSFDELIGWMQEQSNCRIIGNFVEQQGAELIVTDIETHQALTYDKLFENCTREWSEQYYSNLKAMIIRSFFMARQRILCKRYSTKPSIVCAQMRRFGA